MYVGPSEMTKPPRNIQARPIAFAVVDLTPDPSITGSNPSSQPPAKKRKSAASESTDGMSKFWSNEGMDTFIDWLADPINHERLHRGAPTAGHRPADLHKEIAEIVNSKHNTTWDTVAVKSKIAYTKKKYDAARKLATVTGGGDTEEITPMNAMLDECPFYEKLHKVYVGSLNRNAPSPKQPQRPEIVRNSELDESPAVDDSTIDEFEGALSSDSDSSIPPQPASKGKQRKEDTSILGRNLMKTLNRLERSCRKGGNRLGAASEEWLNREQALIKRLDDIEAKHTAMLHKRELALEQREMDFKTEKQAERERIDKEWTRVQQAWTRYHNMAAELKTDLQQQVQDLRDQMLLRRE
ncbi:hypothetical protein EMPS_02468 [Entomortierella parvispora]|uniref:Myb/SANT-like domain-containing protein n=1 Tax=Entomortierella parvispora TaxID=205924 RepID=A0A9P3LTP4_9FUNG|nr:hypothetical protein EMPS_02468 [Entomortierella parvispora]